MLRGGADSLGAVGGGLAGVLGSQLPGRVQQAAAEVLKLAQSGGGHGQSAPAARCTVEHGPDDADAAGLTGKSADNLCAATGFAEGALDEVRMPDAVMMLGRKPQISGQALAVGGQELHRRRVDGGVTVGERAQAGID